MELIDKQQAFVTLTEHYKHRTLIEHLILSEALDRVPVVDAEPVKHGRWIKFEHGEDKYYCDKCQTIWESKQIKNMHYCPTCGAKMDKQEKQNDS